MAKEESPLIKQYRKIKEQHPESVVFFRVGDFYETFCDDAVTASRALDITLTRKNAGGGSHVPLAGVPYHAADNYIAKLIKKGFKVAVCEQVENPKEAKGLVKREVVRVITPGTIVENNLLDEKSNNYLLCLVMNKNEIGLAFADLSTGEFKVSQIADEVTLSFLKTQLVKIQPAEILISKDSAQNPVLMRILKQDLQMQNITIGEDWIFSTRDIEETICMHFEVSSLQGFGIEEWKLGQLSVGALIRYFQETQRNAIGHMTNLEVFHLQDYMLLDETTQRSLELVTPLHYSSQKATLYHILDETLTPMGGRLLKRIILEPLKQQDEIEQRLDRVEYCYKNHIFRETLGNILESFPDLERLASRISLNSANGRDMIAIRNGLRKIQECKEFLKSEKAPVWEHFESMLLPQTDIAELIDHAIVEEPPISLREGGLIKSGYSQEHDELKSMTKSNKQWILSFQQKEIERTGISKLKIGFNKVFGYYIEVTKANSGSVPEDYIRKQTLVNAERYITPELKEKENMILSADERIKELEYDIFCKIREQVNQDLIHLLQNAKMIAQLDIYYSLGFIAVKHDYVRPTINQEHRIQILNGRHPVVERLLDDGNFVANDVYLKNGSNQVMLITGPNMAGKSTYIRQVALLVLMAHIGSFVPASSADICIVDRIFTRVGAMDFIARGQSTFLVEMIETANILNNATDDSLVILDEIGRGTSTYDGLSIAWAVIKYLVTHSEKQAKTLFATHYHELTELQQLYPEIQNYNVAILEEDDKVIFLYKIKEGSTDHSYGIYAAQVAGIPFEVIESAQDILLSLEAKGKAESYEISQDLQKEGKIEKRPIQNTLFGRNPMTKYPYDKIVSQLKSMDIENTTPLQALNQLAKLQKQSWKATE